MMVGTANNTGQKPTAAEDRLEVAGCLGQVVGVVCYLMGFLHPFGLAETLGEWLFSWFAKPTYLNTSDAFRDSITMTAAFLIYGPLFIAGLNVGAASRARKANSATSRWYDYPMVRVAIIILLVGALCWWAWLGSWETLATLPDPNVNQSDSWATFLFLSLIGAVAWSLAAGWGLARLVRMWLLLSDGKANEDKQDGHMNGSSEQARG
ncbi:MAG: hypothetical protein VYD64_05920 [Pseudomonadota bacterium]|nr:hypothetical protein [Pseudomonadota bacterium]